MAYLIALFQILFPILASTPPPAAGVTYTLQSHQASTLDCQGAGNCNGTITITSGRVGIFIYIDSGNGTLPTLTDNGAGGSNTWTRPAGCDFNSANGSTAAFYNMNTTKSATTVTLNSANFINGDLNYYEYTTTGGTPVFDVCNAGASAGSGGSNPGISLSITGTDTIVEGVGNSSNVIITGVSAGWGNFLVDPGAGGSRIATADNQNTASGTAPTWTASTAGAAAAVGIAVK